MTRLLLVFLAFAVTARAATMEEVTIISAQTVGTTADLKTIPLGTLTGGVCMLTTSAVSGTSPTLDLYLQSVVGGVDDDYCRFGQVIGTGSQILRFPGPAVTSGAAVAVSDRASGVSASACRAGLPGARLKIAAVIGGSATPTVTFTLTCHFLRL